MAPVDALMLIIQLEYKAFVFISAKLMKESETIIARTSPVKKIFLVSLISQLTIPYVQGCSCRKI